MTIQEMLAKLPTKSHLSAFDNERYFGVVIRFSESGFGFGEITMSVDKTTGAPRCDLEEMTPERCGVLLMRTVGTVVENDREVQ